MAEWQTRWTQNPVGLTPRVGSTPTSGTKDKNLTFAKKNVGNRNSYSLSDRSLGGHGREEKGIQSS